MAKKIKGPQDVMTVPQAAAFLQVTEQTILRGLRAGTIPGNKIGARWRLSRLALEAHLAKPQAPAPPKKRKAKAKRKATRQ